MRTKIFGKSVIPVWKRQSHRQTDESAFDILAEIPAINAQQFSKKPPPAPPNLGLRDIGIPPRNWELYEFASASAFFPQTTMHWFRTGRASFVGAGLLLDLVGATGD